MRYIYNIAVLVFLLILTGCLNNKQGDPEIGLLIHAFDKERWENDRNFFVQRVEELGGTVHVKIADNKPDKQLAQAIELLANGVDVLVVVPVDQFAAAEIVKEAHEKGAQVISYDRLIKNCKLDFYVSTDNVEIGALQADYLSTIKPTGKYALIGGAESDNNSQFLYLGQMNVLQPLIQKGDIEIIYNEFTDSWSEEEGYEHTKKILANDAEVDAIIAANDAIAIGVLEALVESGKEQEVLLAGMDADLKNLQAIVAGQQTCTVYKPYEKLASTAAEVAMKMAVNDMNEKTYQTVSNGERLVPVIYHEAMIVNRENLKLTVISEGYQKAEEVYK